MKYPRIRIGIVPVGDVGGTTSAQLKAVRHWQDFSPEFFDRIYLGRGPSENGVKVFNIAVNDITRWSSRKHALVHFVNGQWLVKDVGSLHGTHLSGLIVPSNGHGLALVGRQAQLLTMSELSHVFVQLL